ncbi:MAG: C-GCAxxG-C-C family protein [Candidatus Omnitrophica bacterium]|nr:C-GCAxxG-C-C family protein [Candidatus Omnitrophota bacterium]
MIEKAKNYFLGKGGRRYNCAQSVIKAYSDSLGFSLAPEAHASSGGGRAPGGYCGALYAALCVLEGEGSRKVSECEEFFKKRFGALTCKEIKSSGKAPCLDCVGKAAEFLEKEFLKKE